MKGEPEKGCNNEILISIIMPVYNAEKYLKEAVDSVLTQDFNEFELICVDDGSEDDSLSILKEYQKKDNRIKVLRNTEEAEGAAVARNLGLSCALGKYVIFLDADDFFESNMLGTVYTHAEETGVDIVIFDAWSYDNESKEVSVVPWTIVKDNIPQKSVFTPDDCKDVIFDLTGGQAWNKLYRRSFIIENGIRFAGNPDDQFFTFLAFACSESISVVHERFLYYRFNAPRNQSEGYTTKPETGYMATEMLYTELKKRNMYETYKVALANRGLATAITFLNYMSNEVCFEELYNNLKYNYLQRWGCYDIPQEKIDQYRKVFLDCITKYSAIGYLFNEYRWRRREMAGALLGNKLKQLIQKQGKVVVYGAGKRGKQLFSDLFKSEIAEVVLWVDKDYARIGYPIHNPEELKSTEYDYIVIAIECERTAKEVKNYLLQMNISEKKIIQLFCLR